jgi:antitoxin CptB
MLELDLLFGDFLDSGYEQLGPGEQQSFDHLLDYPDAILLEWLMGRMQPTDKDVIRLVDKIRSAASD